MKLAVTFSEFFCNVNALMMENYLEINKSNWDNKVEVHYNSAFYDMDSFLKGKNALMDIELGLLGDITDKKILHLQCHFGQDSISLSRMGAKVTGVDFSEKAIEKARFLNHSLDTDVNFVLSDIYSLSERLNDKFDLVFTSYGTIGWLPDLNKWADTIAHFLNPGGEFIIVDFHPVVWMFDDDFNEIYYSYFNREPIVENTTGTYADPDSPIKNNSVSWNHSLSEMLNALLKAGLEINSFDEYDYSPYNCFNNTFQIDSDKYQIKNLAGKIPMVYALKAKSKI